MDLVYLASIADKKDPLGPPEGNYSYRLANNLRQCLNEAGLDYEERRPAPVHDGREFGAVTFNVFKKDLKQAQELLKKAQKLTTHYTK